MAPGLGRAVASHLRQSFQWEAGSRIGLSTPARASSLLHHRPGLHGQRKQSIVNNSSSSSRCITSFAPSKFNHSDTVRKLMRQVPHPVAIVTAAPTKTTDNKTSASHWRGATISSFVTVTLDPEPVVCFNIKQNSSTYATLAQSAHFNIHILRSGPEAEVIATKFASGNALEPFHDGEGELEWWVREPVADEGSAPVIEGDRDELEAEGGAKDSVVSFRLSCDHIAEKTVSVGDHVVVFGRVTDVMHGLDEEQAESGSSAPCLLYVGGGYSLAASK